MSTARSGGGAHEGRREMVAAAADAAAAGGLRGDGPQAVMRRECRQAGGARGQAKAGKRPVGERPRRGRRVAASLRTDGDWATRVVHQWVPICGGRNRWQPPKKKPPSRHHT